MRLRACFSFCLIIVGALLPVFANQIQSVRIWPSPDSTRVVFDLTEKPAFSLQPRNNDELLLVIDDIEFTSFGQMLGESELVKSIKIKRLKDKKAGITLTLAGTSAEKAFYLSPTDRYGHRLVVDLTNASRPQEQPVVVKASSREGRAIIIAIDAGHGGHDPGAVGPKGTYEKHVTMAIAQKLKVLIDKEPGFQAQMTRSSDYYIYPSKRPELARNKRADLLVSIHADAAENRKASGASVWILSLKRATTEVGRMLEQTEQHSELLGGVAEVIKDSESERYFNQTVLDLQMQHSMGTGFDVAKSVLVELGKVTKLHKKEPQSASLGVLKAPDIPSILVETGYISNISEEQKLKSAAHQQKLANALFKALKGYFHRNPPADSKFALGSRATAPRYVPADMPSEPVQSISQGSTDELPEPEFVSNTEPRSANKSQPGLPSGSPSASQLATVKADSIEMKGPSKTAQPTAKVKSPPNKPTAKASSDKVRLHKVKSGDSLTRLAKKYGVSMAELRSFNRLKSDNIQIGQTLKIPTP
jgi:N-acetylmuramoyl-L-alanine amidase